MKQFKEVHIQATSRAISISFDESNFGGSAWVEVKTRSDSKLAKELLSVGYVKNPKRSGFILANPGKSRSYHQYESALVYAKELVREGYKATAYCNEYY